MFTEKSTLWTKPKFSCDMIQSSQLLCNHRCRSLAILYSIHRQHHQQRRRRYSSFLLGPHPFVDCVGSPLTPIVSAVSVGASTTTMANAFRGGSSTGRITHRCTYRYYILVWQRGICDISLVASERWLTSQHFRIQHFFRYL